MRSRLAVGCLVATGCSFHSPVVDGDANRGGGDGTDSCSTFSHQFDTCEPGIGTNVEMLAGGSYHYSTDDGSLTLNSTPIASPPSVMTTGRAGPMRVITADTFTLAAGST